MKSMTKIALMLCSVTLLAACEPSSEHSSPDQCLRAQLFQQCLKALPAGPQSTKDNDWDEVVRSCDSVAFYQSYRARKLITPECRI